MPIPTIAHRIWFGPDIPKKYLDSLRHLAETSTDYSVILWSCSLTMPKDQYDALGDICEDNHILLCDIATHTDYINYDLIMSEIHASITDALSHRKLHFVRASDLCRIAVLYETGGVYTDTDKAMLAPLPVLDAKNGILFSNSLGMDKACYDLFGERFYFDIILYDFIAAEPFHSVMESTAQISKLDYETYRTQASWEWEKSRNSIILKEGTTKLTGTALKRAINFLYQNGRIVFSDPEDLFLKTNLLISNDYDKSWLSGFTEEMKTSHTEQTSLNIFVGKIDAVRNKPHNYPINTPLAPHSSFIDRFPADLFSRLPIPVPSKIVTPPFVFKWEPIKIQLPAISTFPCIKELKNSYIKNGGSYIAAFSIFKSRKSTAEVIDELRTRAIANRSVSGASRRTLLQYNLSILKNSSSH